MIKILVVIACAISCAIALPSCGTEHLPQVSITGSAMGTQFNITIVDSGQDSIDELANEIQRILDSLNSQLSTYIPESDISKFNLHASTGWFETTVQFCTALENALTLSRQTEGAFDISVGQLVELWGFGADRMILEPPPSEKIARALETTGYEKLHTDCDQRLIRKDHPGLFVDLSGYAKGLAIDEVSRFLDERRLQNYMAELGGEIRVRGHNGSQAPWRIAIEKPDGGDRSVQSVIRISNGAVATSGDYRNYFEHDGVRYSHTIDTRTGRPITHELASVTVVSKEAAFADAMATALLVLGPDEGFAFAERENIAAYFLLRRASVIEEMTTTSFALLESQ